MAKLSIVGGITKPTTGNKPLTVKIIIGGITVYNCNLTAQKDNGKMGGPANKGCSGWGEVAVNVTKSLAASKSNITVCFNNKALYFDCTCSFLRNLINIISNCLFPIYPTVE